MMARRKVSIRCPWINGSSPSPPRNHPIAQTNWMPSWLALYRPCAHHDARCPRRWRPRWSRHGSRHHPGRGAPHGARFPAGHRVHDERRGRGVVGVVRVRRSELHHRICRTRLRRLRARHRRAGLPPNGGRGGAWPPTLGYYSRGGLGEVADTITISETQPSAQIVLDVAAQPAADSTAADTTAMDTMSTDTLGM